jgi:hypothetical protein
MKEAEKLEWTKISWSNQKGIFLSFSYLDFGLHSIIEVEGWYVFSKGRSQVDYFTLQSKTLPGVNLQPLAVNFWSYKLYFSEYFYSSNGSYVIWFQSWLFC